MTLTQPVIQLDSYTRILYLTQRPCLSLAAHPAPYSHYPLFPRAAQTYRSRLDIWTRPKVTCKCRHLPKQQMLLQLLRRNRRILRSSVEASAWEATHCPNDRFPFKNWLAPHLRNQQDTAGETKVQRRDDNHLSAPLRAVYRLGRHKGLQSNSDHGPTISHSKDDSPKWPAPSK